MNAHLKLRNDAIAWRQIEGEVVALELERSNYLGLNRTGARLWAALSEGASREALVDALVDGFDADRAAAERDVGEFLSVLDARGLLES